ncbi:GIY-YIG nuclease family protein, partial [Legionella pneumophila serogroup 1]
DMISAIAREKQLKGGLRKKKLVLIEKLNPYWEDLYEKLL